MASVPVLARLIARPLESLGEHLPAALEGVPHSVHQARVASRRLRELLPVVGGVLGRGARRRLRRRLRTVTRVLGPVRELDVALASIDRLIEGQPTPSALAVALKRQFVQQRVARLATLTRRLDSGRVERLLARLHRLESRLADGAEPREWASQLAARVSRRASALSGAVADAGALFVSERLHTVRIAAKQLRYALEVVGEARLAATAPLVRSLKDTQDILGALHDRDLLLAALHALAGDAVVERPETGATRVKAGAQQADTLKGDALKETLKENTAWFDREITAETRRLHARYLRRQTRLVGVADHALDAVVPRLEQIDRSHA
jgi:CHAD domain-containing protein